MLINCTQFISLHNKITRDKEERISNSSKKEVQNLNTTNIVSCSFASGVTEFMKPLGNCSVDIINSLARIESYFRMKELIDNGELIKSLEPLKKLQENMKVLSSITKLNDELQGFSTLLNKYIIDNSKLINNDVTEESIEEKDC